MNNVIVLNHNQLGHILYVIDTEIIEVTNIIELPKQLNTLKTVAAEVKTAAYTFQAEHIYIDHWSKAVKDIVTKDVPVPISVLTRDDLVKIRLANKVVDLLFQ